MEHKNNFFVVGLVKITFLLFVYLVVCGCGGNDFVADEKVSNCTNSVIQYDKKGAFSESDGFVERKPLEWVVENGANHFEKEKIVSKKEFFGNADMAIQYYTYDPKSGKDTFIEEKYYHYKVKIFIQAPLKIRTVTESNPFNIAIYSNRDVNSVQEGNIDIVSASLFTVNSFSDVLMQYWNIFLTGDKFSGTLVKTHRAEAVAANMLWAWEETVGFKTVIPFPIAVNTSIEGVLAGNVLKLTIKGETVDTYRKFVVKIIAHKKGR